MTALADRRRSVSSACTRFSGSSARSTCTSTTRRLSARPRSRRIADDEQFTRFTPFERFLHLMVVTSFLLLVITGMPLKFYYTDWAKTIFSLLGGAEVARALHHFGAIVTFAYFGLHLRRTWRSLCGDSARSLRSSATGRLELRRAVVGAVRAGLDGAVVPGLARLHRPPEMVLRQGSAAAVRPLDLLGAVRLFRGVLGHLRRSASPA